MAKLDFWWDEPDTPPPVNFDSMVREVVRWRPASRRPILAVLGNIRRFYGSALYKSVRQTGLLQAVDFNELPDEEITRPDVVLIRWGVIPPRQRARIPAGVRVLNDTHLDTDKNNVEEKFAAVAGYSSFVDPNASSGLAITKSRENAAHDGRVVRLPLTGFDSTNVICQRLVNNSLGDYVTDIRVAFVLGNPILAVVKLRERSRRFDNANAYARLLMPSEVLTDEEIGICRRFCEAIGLEFGELDILRDGPAGRIYIVDANDGPAGPTKALPEVDRYMAFRLMAAGFLQHVLKRP